MEGPARVLLTAGGVALLACALGGCAVPGGVRATPTAEAVFRPGVTATPTVASTPPASCSPSIPDSCVTMPRARRGEARRGEGGIERPPFPFASLDPRFAAKVRVVGVNLGGVWRAYPVEAVEQARMVQATVAGVTVVLISAGQGKGVQVYDAQGTRFERV
ncbi:MAG: DUF3179 domain-containing protein, partial [Dehalococcoidia bacterium]|nr:DUF3179 domain-containing protein [Dehalococcoidia bacterium]